MADVVEVNRLLAVSAAAHTRWQIASETRVRPAPAFRARALYWVQQPEAILAAREALLARQDAEALDPGHTAPGWLAGLVVSPVMVAFWLWYIAQADAQGL
jgi:hypothetical protein